MGDRESPQTESESEVNEHIHIIIRTDVNGSDHPVMVNCNREELENALLNKFGEPHHYEPAELWLGSDGNGNVTGVYSIEQIRVGNSL